MTALCPGGGTSGPKPGVLTGIAFDATSVGAFVTEAGYPELDAPIAVIAAGVALTVDVFCGTDPPADPGITPNDIIEINNPTSPQSWATAAGRIKDWFLHNYWWQVCECQGATTPAAPTPVLPTGTGTNTGLPTGTTNSTCWDVNSAFQWGSPPAAPQIASADLHQVFLPTNPTITIPSTITTPQVLAPHIPPGVTQGFWNATSDKPNTGIYANDIRVRLWDDNANFVGDAVNMGFGGNAALSQHGTFTIPSTATHWDCFWTNTDPANTYNATFEFAFYCSGQTPLTLTTPCCPPDPLIQQYLQVILNIVSNLYTTPAGTPSTGWADAAAHPGLSGTGSFQLGKNVTGIRANFTTIPPGIRVTAGTPTFYWDLGFVTPVAAVVPLRSLRTVFATQAMPLPIQTTAIDYTFPAGAVVTLTELVAA